MNPSVNPSAQCPECGSSHVRDRGVYVAHIGDDPALAFSAGSFGSIDLGKHRFECEACGAEFVRSK